MPGSTGREPDRDLRRHQTRFQCNTYTLSRTFSPLRDRFHGAAIRMTLCAGGQINREDKGLTRMTGLRSCTWSVGERGGSLLRFAWTRRTRRSGRELPKARRKRRLFSPMRTARTCSSKAGRNPGREKPLTTPRPGPRTEMETAFERFAFAPPECIGKSPGNRLRLLRGGRKDHLSGYVAMFESALDHDWGDPEILQCGCGV